MRSKTLITSLALLAAVSLAACRSDESAQSGTTGNNSGNGNSRGTGSARVNRVASITLPSGTPIDVSLGTALSSESAQVGDGWSGEVRTATYVSGREIIPAGSRVTGVVSSVSAARKGDRAMLDLKLTSVTVADQHYSLNGGTEAVIAGSTRARNLGVIAGAAAAGAVIGHAVGRSGKGTLIGGLLGAGAATGVVSETKGWQVVLKTGTPITFTTSEALAVRE